jgi:hypothetical protein
VARLSPAEAAIRTVEKQIQSIKDRIDVLKAQLMHAEKYLASIKGD